MIVQSRNEKEALREGGKILAAILQRVGDMVKPGLATIELDAIAEAEIRKAGGRPAFKNYQTRGTSFPYPATLCVSVNDEVVHGIPGKRILKKGDIVGLDIGMQYKGYFTDTAITVPVGEIDNEAQHLIDTAKEALEIGIAKVKAGVRVGDIGEAIQIAIEKEGFGVVRELVGHGVGSAVHEDPEVPNWGKRGTGPILTDGMVIALEPMVTEGLPKLKTSRDGWVWLTADSKRASHFEHTMLVTKKGVEVLT